MFSDNPTGASSNPLIIGAVTFASSEVPNGFTIGEVNQKLVVTELIGGGRVVQALGPQPEQVSWNGNLWESSNVQAKVAALRAYATSGNEILLSWFTERYYCKVKTFRATYHHVNRASYDITCEVTRDANGSLGGASPTSVDSQVSSLNTEAGIQSINIAQVDGSFNGVVSPTDIAGIGTTISAAGPIAQASPSALSSIGQTITTVLAKVNSYASMLPPGAAQLLPTTRLQNVLNLLHTNVQAGQSPQSIRMQGGSLFAVASQYYGTAEKAFDLMAANGLASPVLSKFSPTNINLPPFAKG